MDKHKSNRQKFFGSFFQKRTAFFLKKEAKTFIQFCPGEAAGASL
jgi:hypothetical protein